MDANGTGALRGKSILVTGGGSGIGLGVASLLAASGAHHAADVTDEDSVTGTVAAATAVTGRLYGAIACAGGNETIAPLTQIDVDAWRRTVDLNVTGTMLTLKHSARELVRGGGGSFVAISSIASSNTQRRFGAYGVDGGQMLRRGPDFSSMPEQVYGVAGLRGVVVQ